MNIFVGFTLSFVVYTVALLLLQAPYSPKPVRRSEQSLLHCDCSGRWCYQLPFGGYFRESVNGDFPTAFDKHKK